MTLRALRFLAWMAAVAGVLALGYALERRIEARGYALAQAEYSAKLEQAERQYLNDLAQARAREQHMQERVNAQELQDAENQKRIGDLRERLRSELAHGLRDPYSASASGAARPGEATQAPGRGAANAAPACGVLSAELAQFLFEQASIADAVNAAYASCKGYIDTLNP